jgi:UDP-N-acetylmuramoylalanine--D-glutamate ligase
VLVASQTWLVLGLARSGVAAAGLLNRQGAKVIGYDDTTAETLEALWVRHTLKEQAHDAFASLLLKDTDQTLPAHLDGIVISPGFPATHPVVVANADKVPVLGEMELASRFFHGRSIVITGTNGKTTTTELVAHILNQAGYHAEPLGNLGRPFAGLADAMDAHTIAVLEASSFQLETLKTFHPNVGAVLNLAPDHLDRYESLDDYYEAKGNLARALIGRGTFVAQAGGEAANRWTTPNTRLFGDRDLGADVYLDDGALWRRNNDEPEMIIDLADMGIAGAPNHLNAAAAVACVGTCGLQVEDLAAGLRSFRGLPHRQQIVGRRDNLVFVNDSKATNVHAVCSGLAGYSDNVAIILGGSGKGEDYGQTRGADRSRSGSHRAGDGRLRAGFTGVIDARRG